MIKIRFIMPVIVCVATLGFPCLKSGICDANSARKTTEWAVNKPDRETPAILRDVWLRYHEDDLCEKVDAAFLFHKGEMGVVINAENGEANKELLKLLEPLSDSYQIRLYTVHMPTQQSLADIRSAPPSFMANTLLTKDFGDSEVFDMEGRSLQPSPSPSFSFSQRMLIFARNTLEYNWKVERYAAHLPYLIQAALDPAATPEQRKQDLAICREHVKKLDKYAKKLKSNLARALPEVSIKPQKNRQRADSIPAIASAVDIATRISADAQDLYLDVYRFLYPPSHTVELSDLRNPEILKSVSALQKMTKELRTNL